MSFYPSHMICTVHTVKLSYDIVYPSHMICTVHTVLHSDCHANISTTLTNLDHHMLHTLIPSPFQTAESKWERKIKREGNGRGKAAALQRHSLHHRALLLGWWHVLFPLVHKYTPTIHTLSSPAVCPVLLRRRHGEGCSDVEGQCVTDLRQVLLYVRFPFCLIKVRDVHDHLLIDSITGHKIN